MERDTQRAADGSRPARVQATYDLELDADSVEAQLEVSLQYILAVMRFAHYIKIVGRDEVGSSQTASAAKAYLDRWLDASEQVSGEASVEEVTGEPGAFRAVAILRRR